MKSVDGAAVTDHLMKLMIERGFAFNTIADRSTLLEIKKKRCYVTLDFEEELKSAAAEGNNSIEEPYELPDGSFISIANERFRYLF